MVDEIVRVLQKTNEHGFVLEILVRDVASCRHDTENSVDELPS